MRLCVVCSTRPARWKNAYTCSDEACISKDARERRAAYEKHRRETPRTMSARARAGVRLNRLRARVESAAKKVSKWQKHLDMLRRLQSAAEAELAELERAHHAAEEAKSNADAKADEE